MEAYHVEDGVLRVLRDLRQDFDLSFDQACATLIAEPHEKLLIDLTAISYISSTYIGMIAATFFLARNADKNLEIRAHPPIINILEKAGFAEFIQLDSIPPGQ